jgi:hypothetical protein
VKHKILEEVIILINRLLEVSETLPNVALNSLLYIKQYAPDLPPLLLLAEKFCFSTSLLLFFCHFCFFHFFSAFLKSCFLRSHLKFLDTNKSIFKNSKRHSLQSLIILLFLYHLQFIMRIIDAFY